MARAWLQNLRRRALGLDQLDRVEEEVLDARHVALTINHAAFQQGHELLQLRADVLGIMHRTTHLEDVAVKDLAARVGHAELALATLVQQAAWLGASDLPVEGPLVSVVVPTWERASEVTAALRSLQRQSYRSWEAIVVDDGSEDGTDRAVKPFLDDPRITYERIPHGGPAAARNHGVEQTGGELVAYLDSDNTWHPTHLARMVHALTDQPDAEWSLSGQLIVDDVRGTATVRNTLRSTDALIDENYCDLNAVAHRRSAVAGAPFDASLLRMSDWDLVLRLAARGEPARIDAVTSAYRSSSSNRITDTVPGHRFAHLIRARHRGRPAAGLRVLFAEWHYPQVTETYIGAPIAAFGRLGAEVQVWSEASSAVLYPAEVPVHHGPLAEAIERVQPHVVVTHWLSKGIDLREITRATGIPHVVCSHGFEYAPSRVAELLTDRGVLVHTFPHLVDAAWADHPRVDVTVAAFDEARYFPSPAGPAAKDRRLVARTSAGLHTKDLDTFLLTARLCPDHRFVLGVARSSNLEEQTDEIVARAAELGSPAEVRIDLQHDETADLLGRAGIYMHTHGTDHPVGMPISIAESMATGAFVLGRDLPGVREYIAGGGEVYSGETPDDRAADAAAIIRGTADWTDAMWSAQFDVSVNQAFQHHASVDVADHMLRAWRRTFALPARTDR